MKAWRSNLAPLLGLLVMLLCGGCVHPKVTYEQDPSNDYTGHIKFRLAATRVVLGEGKLDPQDDKKSYVDIKTHHPLRKLEPKAVSILLVPREDDSMIYGIIPQSQWLWTVQTKLSVSYFDNTRLVKSVGTQVEDHRIEAIQAIGTIAKTAMVAAAPSREPSPKEPSDPNHIAIPVAIDVEPDQTTWKDLPENQGWYYKVGRFVKEGEEVDTLVKETDAVERNAYFTKYKDRFFSLFYSTRTIPASSCLEAHLVVGTKDNNGKIQQRKRWPIQLADYKNVRTYELPDKGSIATHTLCGADIVTEKADTSSAWQLLSEIVTQAKAIREAQKTDSN